MMRRLTLALASGGTACLWPAVASAASGKLAETGWISEFRGTLALTLLKAALILTLASLVGRGLSESTTPRQRGA